MGLQKEESLLRERWKVRDQMLWERIELVIKLEEDKVKAKLEEERKAQEEEEAKRKKEELMRRLIEEKKKQEEEERKKQEEEERRAKEEQKKKEEEEEKRMAEEEKAKAEKLKAEEEGRKQIGLTTADEDWRVARGNLSVSGWAPNYSGDLMESPTETEDGGHEGGQVRSLSQSRVG
jgi:nucleoporin GLE1